MPHLFHMTYFLATKHSFLPYLHPPPSQVGGSCLAFILTIEGRSRWCVKYSVTIHWKLPLRWWWKAEQAKHQKRSQVWQQGNYIGLYETFKSPCTRIIHGSIRIIVVIWRRSWITKEETFSSSSIWILLHFNKKIR